MGLSLISAIVVVLATVGASSLVEVVRKWWLVRRMPGRYLGDLSHVGTEPSDRTAQMIGEFNRLGFRRVGEAGLPKDRRARFWYLVDDKRTTVAAVYDTAGRGYATIYSWFGDEACIVHSIPLHGIPVVQSDFLYRPVNATPAVAYPQHLAAVQAFRNRFGPARNFDNMTQILRLDAVYNHRFFRRRVAPDIRREGIMAGGALGLAIVLKAILLFNEVPH